MKRKTCEFVSATDVFFGCSLAWNAFANSDPDCTWGNNNRSMITSGVIIDALDNNEDELAEKQIKLVKRRLERLGQTYIDLES